MREYTKEDAYPIVRDIYNSTIFTDIVRINHLRKIDQFERVVRYVFENVGNTFSASSIAKHLKSEQRTLDNGTVYNYLSKLERGLEQVHAGLGITKTMEELEAMAEDGA